MMNPKRAGIYFVLLVTAGLALYTYFKGSSDQKPRITQPTSKHDAEREELKRKIKLEDEVRAEVDKEQREEEALAERKLSRLQERQNELMRKLEAQKPPAQK